MKQNVVFASVLFSVLLLTSTAMLFTAMVKPELFGARPSVDLKHNALKNTHPDSTAAALAKIEKAKQTANSAIQNQRPKDSSKQILASNDSLAHQNAMPAAELPRVINQDEMKSIAKLYDAMKPEDAAKILNKMNDKDVRVILLTIKKKQAAKILMHFDSQRAAQILSN